MEVPSGTPTSHYLAVGPQHQGGPLTIQPPAACTAAYLYPHPSVILTYPGLFAAFRVPLPRNPALVGQQFRVQGASSSFPTGCLKFTDGILVTIRP
jgi:hypothetical protein